MCVCVCVCVCVCACACILNPHSPHILCMYISLCTVYTHTLARIYMYLEMWSFLYYGPRSTSHLAPYTSSPSREEEAAVQPLRDAGPPTVWSCSCDLQSRHAGLGACASLWRKVEGERGSEGVREGESERGREVGSEGGREIFTYTSTLPLLPLPPPHTPCHTHTPHPIRQSWVRGRHLLVPTPDLGTGTFAASADSSPGE